MGSEIEVRLLLAKIDTISPARANNGSETKGKSALFETVRLFVMEEKVGNKADTSLGLESIVKLPVPTLIRFGNENDSSAALLKMLNESPDAISPSRLGNEKDAILLLLPKRRPPTVAKAGNATDVRTALPTTQSAVPTLVRLGNVTVKS